MGVGRLHVSLSGTLLETLSDPRFQERVYGIVDCGSLLWHLQNTRTIEVLGTAYYHPVLSLIPPADREEQIARWLGLGRHLFWRDRFRGASGRRNSDFAWISCPRCRARATSG